MSKKVPFEKSFASFKDKDKVASWNYELNNDLTPKDVYRSTSKKYYFTCYLCSHIFHMSPNNITNIKGRGWCPFCSYSRKQLCKDKSCKQCLKNSFASFDDENKLKSWDFERNKITPRDIFMCSPKRVHFKCYKCKHNFNTQLCNITSKAKNWCPYCSEPCKKLCDNKDCNMCFSKSVASFDKEKIKNWDYERNKCSPRDVLLSSVKKYSFNCSNCKHSFEISMSDLKRNHWCSYCCYPCQKLCEDSKCKFCFKNSFASCDKPCVKWWDNEKNDCTPRNVLKGTTKKYYFKCFTCKHSFKASVASQSKSSIGCPYCSKNIMCYSKDCLFCFENSFASFDDKEKLNCWNEELNGFTPRDVFKGSEKKCWFKCFKCKTDFCQLLYHISGPRQGWCPKCRHKTELKLLNHLKITHPDVKTQFKAKWCKNPDTKRYLPFDYVIPSLNVIIELDGAQHFKQVSNWTSPEETQECDKYKMKMANDNGYTVVRILQEDVLYDKNSWKRHLSNVLRKYDEPEFVYICDGKEYEFHLD